MLSSSFAYENEFKNKYFCLFNYYKMINTKKINFLDFK